MSAETAVRVILQARTDSTRLPAKALLPVAGMPSAVLAARRAANRGHDVLLATTSRPVDDELVAVARRAGINVFRGPAEDVRLRFIQACADLDDNAIIVRLTADNLLPDGELVAQCVTFFRRCGVHYINTDAVFSACPYGLSVEVFRVDALKRSTESHDTPSDREHVTPALRKAVTASNLPPQYSLPRAQARLRCTMDTFEDYQNVLKAFEKASDPVSIGWQALLSRFPHQSDSFDVSRNKPHLVLGTAQLAAPYGTIKKTIPPSPSEAIELVRAAIDRGVATIDTASAYSGSETLIGRAIEGPYRQRAHVVTKLSTLSHLTPDDTPQLAASEAENSILRSLLALGPTAKPAVLLHRFQHKSAWDGVVWETLLRCREEGLIGALGVSVQTPREAFEAIRDHQVRLLQIPYNLLDWRWEALPEALEKLENPPQIHARSLFLQGTLLGDPRRWPDIEGVDPQKILDRLNHFVGKFQRESLADLCIAWVRSKRWIDGAVIGMESASQLYENLQRFNTPPLTPEQASELSVDVGRVPERLLNPALWV